MQARRQQKQRRAKALTRSLKERAAVETIQTAVRRCLGIMMKRRLRAKRQAFLRAFTNDQTGHAVRMLIVFQRRVRLWLANNALYLAYYEDHRRFLHQVRPIPKPLQKSCPHHTPSLLPCLALPAPGALLVAL